MKQKKLSDNELYDVRILLLNVSQDIRFAAEFKMKNHDTLQKHLLATHKDLMEMKEKMFDD